jgi:hypothetical protein
MPLRHGRPSSNTTCAGVWVRWRPRLDVCGPAGYPQIDGNPLPGPRAGVRPAGAWSAKAAVCVMDRV